MKKKKLINIILPTVIILTATSIPVILYFTVGQEQNNPSQKINLNQQHIEYLAKVQYMNKITNIEANTIKNDIKTLIKNKLSKLHLEEKTDYTVSPNLDNMQENDNLNNYIDKIIIESVKDSTKAYGSFEITLNVQENISNRSIAPIDVDADQENGLDEDTVKSIRGNIEINTELILNKGQRNIINRDYIIVNLDLIKVNAKFKDYNTKLKVQGISKHLIGEFPINFELNLDLN